MALLHLNFYANSLCANTDVNVILPTPDFDDYLNGSFDYFTDNYAFRVLYLLHGGSGDYSDWVRKSMIEVYAKEHNMAVVMPSLSNSFGYDIMSGPNYFEYVTEELPRFIERVFRIDSDKKSHYIAGLSMGGYIAVKAALARPDHFYAAASLSGVMQFPLSLTENDLDNWKKGMYGPQSLFGMDSLERIKQNCVSIGSTIKEMMNRGEVLPKLLVICGTEDTGIYQENLSFLDEMKGNGADLTFEEYPGRHTWHFWNTYIKRVLEWFDSL